MALENSYATDIIEYSYKGYKEKRLNNYSSASSLFSWSS